MCCPMHVLSDAHSLGAHHGLSTILKTSTLCMRLMNHLSSYHHHQPSLHPYVPPQLRLALLTPHHVNRTNLVQTSSNRPRCSTRNRIRSSALRSIQRYRSRSCCSSWRLCGCLLRDVGGQEDEPESEGCCEEDQVYVGEGEGICKGDESSVL